MEYVQPVFYDKFKCIGGSCEDSCCIGWEVEVDDDTYDYYKNINGEFGDRLKNNMADGEEKSFVIRKNGRCPFLDDNNLCDIYTELGEEHLCSVCTDFPRIYAQIGEYKQVVISISCMEAGKLFFSINEPLTFIIKKNDTAPDEDICDEDKVRFEYLRNIRNTAIAIMQHREIDGNKVSWKKRAACVLDYISKVQNLWNSGNEADVEELCSVDNAGSYISEWLLTENSKVSICENEFKKSCLEMLNSLEGLIPINKSWKKEYKTTKKMIKKNYSDDSWAKFEKSISDNSDVWFEHLMVYFIFRYLILSLYDNNILTKLKLAVASCIIIKCMDYTRWNVNGEKYTFEDRVDVAHIYSREVEHSEDNLEYLTEEIMFNEVFSIDSLKKILSTI